VEAFATIAAAWDLSRAPRMEFILSIMASSCCCLVTSSWAKAFSVDVGSPLRASIGGVVRVMVSIGWGVGGRGGGGRGRGRGEESIGVEGWEG